VRYDDRAPVWPRRALITALAVRHPVISIAAAAGIKPTIRRPPCLHCPVAVECVDHFNTVAPTMNRDNSDDELMTMMTFIAKSASRIPLVYTMRQNVMFYQ